MPKWLQDINYIVGIEIAYSAKQFVHSDCFKSISQGSCRGVHGVMAESHLAGYNDEMRNA